MKVLMVCLGNICRSPIAEGVLQHLAGEAGLDWQVDSAGTNQYHIGEAPHRFSQKVCLSRGINIAQQRARHFRPEDLHTYDLIYALANDVYADMKQIAGPGADMNNVRLFLSEWKEGCTESVPDPWYGDEDGYLPVYELIEQTCKNIIAKYR